MILVYFDMMLTSRGLLSVLEFFGVLTFSTLVVYAPYMLGGNTRSSLSAIDNLSLINVGSSSLVAAKADAAGLSSQTDNLVPANADATDNI